MRGFILSEFDVAPALTDDLPAPTAAEGELVVRVHASSVNPVDAGIASGMLRGMFEYEFPVVLGRDYAGTVEHVGTGVAGFSAGDEVFGFVLHADPIVRNGSWAESTVVSADLVAHAPAGVELASAGAAPLAGITAVTAIDALGVASGSTVLIVGATGGVGSFAVQVAANAGATVIAPALPGDEEYLRSLGVAEIVDRSADVAAAVRELHPDGVDAVLDLVSFTPDALDGYAAVLRPDGRAASPNGAAGEGPGRSNIGAVSTSANLERLARLLDSGAIRVPLRTSYPLVRAGEALQALATEHTQGKLGITVA